jgi:hypothetical protein
MNLKVWKKLEMIRKWYQLINFLITAPCFLNLFKGLDQWNPGAFDIIKKSRNDFRTTLLKYVWIRYVTRNITEPIPEKLWPHFSKMAEADVYSPEQYDWGHETISIPYID